jgi:raffinose/stachyose/melibiose transport system permease protein
MTTRRRRAARWQPYLYVLPAFIVFLLFIGIPLLQTLNYSFFTWDGLSASTWNGVGNYFSLVTDPTLRDSFVHAFVLLIFFSVIPVALGLLLTAVMSRAHRMPGLGFFRTVMFLPQVVTTVAVATIWIAIYAQDGLLNQFLRLIGLGNLGQPWLGSFVFSLPAVGFVGTWLNFGLCVVLFISGVGAIPTERFEAARLDGAGPAREFFAITLPGIRGQLAAALTLTLISGLKTFDLVYVTTNGGPGGTTSVPAFEIYDLAFNQGQVGTAAALGVALTVIISIVTSVINRIQPKEAE